MRLWSLHPRYLDRQGLTACWRESLLAQAVLLGRTRGYRNHPHLRRFLIQPDPAAAVGAYLSGVAAEATARGYRFEVTKIERFRDGDEVPRISVTDGQVAHELVHLLAKLRERSPTVARGLAGVVVPDVHPLFVVVPGGPEPWEIAVPRAADR